MRIVEFGANVAAGYCGRLFSLSGAEVCRIDDAGVELTDAAARAQDIYLHSDKRRISLDYRHPAGRAVLDDLAATADVLVTDESPATLDALDWVSLGQANPRLVRVSITPFGLSGPYRDWSGWGPVLLAMGGYTELIGDPDREPLSLPGNFVEYQAGQYACIASSALLLKDDGQSHDVEISMLEVVLSLSQFTTVLWTCNHEVRSRHGNVWSNLHPVAMYPCRDGWFLVNVVPGFWPAFTKMLGREDLLTHPDFATNQARLKNRQALDDIIRERLSGYSMAEVTEMGQRQFRVPTGGAMSFADVLASDHLAARGYFRSVQLEAGGRVAVPGSAFRFVDGAGANDNPPREGHWQYPAANEADDARTA